MTIPTAILVPLCALVIIAAAIALGRLMKAWRAHRDHDDHTEIDPERLALLDEKARLLQTLADLEHEHSLGKLSDADYNGLKRHFQRETLAVLDRLESKPPAAARGQEAA